MLLDTLPSRSSHPYDFIVGHLKSAFEEIDKLGLRDSVAKGGVGEILLAHYLGHEIGDSDKGFDGMCQGRKYEYKVSTTNQFNFHFGTRSEKETPQDKVRRHFKDIDGAFCAKRKGYSIEEVVYIPSDVLIELLCSHFEKTKGNQLNKNYRLDGLINIPGAEVILSKGHSH